MSHEQDIHQQVESLANNPVVLSYTMLLGCVFVFGIGLYDFFIGKKLLAYLLFSMDFVLFVGLGYLLVTGETHGPRYLYVFSLLAGFYFLLFHGGVEGSGLIWCLCIIPAVILILGYQKSVIVVSVIVASLLMIFGGVMDDKFPLPYSESLQWRFFVALIGVCLFMMGLEYARSSSYQKLIEMGDTVRRAVQFDQLTNLANRREMENLLEQSWGEHIVEGRHYSLLLGGIDYFRNINDQYGYEFGDQLLIDLGATMQMALQNEGVVARWAGDEFLVLLPEMTSEAAQEVADRMREVVADLRWEVFEGLARTTISFGVCDFQRGSYKDELVSLADGALFQAKQMGRDMAVIA